ncbi:F0F1 ATP synthase subunit delta [Rathayibacter sp. YIM 133350]|uniref:F0F1 ATP synthase subunit delta n=1 Tax=Rathayibacter sp. YIM 133350 TaxID=3131992 RepID=UPI00307E30D8
MGSATSQALATVRSALLAQGVSDLASGQALLGAGRVVGGSQQLAHAIADPGADPETKASLITAVFSSTVTPAALALLQEIGRQRWSRAADVLVGIEEIGLRVIAASAPAEVSVDDELFSIARTVSENSELELALSSKLGDNAGKVTLLQKLLGGRASEQTLAILAHLVQQPRGRRMGELLRHAASVVADEAGYGVAVVTSAVPLPEAQVQRLASSLTAKYRRNIRINQVVDPTLIGGLRVQVGDDVIDGSIAKRLGDLRLQLAG